MADDNRIRPRSAIVVGAGIVGLSTAWFLQERGVEVAVVDRIGVAAGASWGNAGWIAPALSIPLNDPRMLRYALRSLPNRPTTSWCPTVWTHRSPTRRSPRCSARLQTPNTCWISCSVYGMPDSQAPPRN